MPSPIFSRSNYQMNYHINKLFGLLSGASLLVVMTFAAVSPASAQGSNQSVSNYYVAGSTQVSGWERNLVQNNLNLGQFHWSAITSSLHARNVAGQANLSRRPAYHYVKPNVRALPGNSLIRTPQVNAHLHRDRKDVGLIADARQVEGALSYTGDLSTNAVLRQSEAVPSYSACVNGSLVNKQLSGRVLSY